VVKKSKFFITQIFGYKMRTLISASLVSLILVFIAPLTVFSQNKTKTQDVIVEGTGDSSANAIKDAFRNAVRQVVGALVDAETLVKNDELVEDKILTYSNGFIKTYAEIPGSGKTQGGIHRVKIKATVETGGVIAKLKASNITVKDVDGKGLFAEVMTKLDSEKDGLVLIEKHLKDFPQNCMSAVVVGGPEIVSKTDEKVIAKFTLKIEPNLKEYKVFTDNIIPVLEKAAFKKGGFFVKMEEASKSRDEKFHKIFINLSNGDFLFEGGLGNKFNPIGSYPNLRSAFMDFKDNGTLFLIGVGRNAAATNLEYKYYFTNFNTRNYEGKNSVLVKLKLVDDDNSTIVSEQIRVVPNFRFLHDEGQGGKFSGKFNFNSVQMYNVIPLNQGFGEITPFLLVDIKVELSPKELQSVKSAKIEIAAYEK
jgi:hypothetical protein